MLKKLSNVYASVDKSKPVVQRRRRVIIDANDSKAMCYIIVDACVRCTVCSGYVKRKQLITMDGYSFQSKLKALCTVIVQIGALV
jgi:hypothetical protein